MQTVFLPLDGACNGNVLQEGGGAPRGRGGRGAAREGWSGRGREFDRHSGTGRGKEISKDGGGSRNWGSNTDVVKQGVTPDAAVAEDGVAAAETVAPVGEAEAAPEVEPEEPVLTFDEVEKHRQAKRSGDLFVTQKEDTTKLLAQLKGAHKVDRNELDEEDTFLSGKKHGGSTATKAVDSEEKETKGECLAN